MDPNGCDMARTVEGLIAAAEARSIGAKRYFTSAPCAHGHIAERNTKNGTCFECARAWRKAHPQVFVQAELRRQQRLCTDEQYAEHRRAQKARAERARRARADKGIRAAERRRRQAALLQRAPRWANKEEIARIYKLASRLTIETGESWHVDHVFPLLGKTVSGLHVHENLQVLRASDNLQKGTRVLQ